MQPKVVWLPWVKEFPCKGPVPALVLSIIAIARTSKGKKKDASSEALTSIGQRYTKGELTKEKYEAMKKDLL